MCKIPYYPNTIPIVFSSDDYFVPYMSVNMQSIIENTNNDKKYCFFVLHKGLSEENINLLKKQILLYYQFSIYFVNVSEYFDGVNFFTSRHITVETYFRLLIPYIFLEYQKVLYLDGDMICLADISALFEIDLGNNMLAAVRDTDCISRYYCPDDIKNIKYWHEVLPNLKEPNTYFNGGLILFNNPLFREVVSLEDIFNLAISKKWYFHDQDVLNFLTDGKRLMLPCNWNYLHTQKSIYLPENLLIEHNDAKKNPKILHFGIKPLDRENYIPFFEYFWKYATRTPFVDIIVRSMDDKGFISYENFPERILSNIIHRKGIGLKFILVDCIKAWFHRDKK